MLIEIKKLERVLKSIENEITPDIKDFNMRQRLENLVSEAWEVLPKLKKIGQYIENNSYFREKKL